jgi:hypothetical protein
MATRSVSSAVACKKRLSLLVVVFQYFPKVASNSCWGYNRVIQNAGQNAKNWSVCRWNEERNLGEEGAPNVVYEETNPAHPPYAEIRRMNACGANLKEGQSFDVLMAPERTTLRWTRRTGSKADVRRYFAEVYSKEEYAADRWRAWKQGGWGASPKNSFAMFNVHPLVEKWTGPKNQGTVRDKVGDWCRDPKTQDFMGIYSGSARLGKIVPADIDALTAAMNACTRSGG